MQLERLTGPGRIGRNPPSERVSGTATTAGRNRSSPSRSTVPGNCFGTKLSRIQPEVPTRLGHRRLTGNLPQMVIEPVAGLRLWTPERDSDRRKEAIHPHRGEWLRGKARANRSKRRRQARLERSCERRSRRVIGDELSLHRKTGNDKGERRE